MNSKNGVNGIGLLLLVVGVVLAALLWPDIPFNPPEMMAVGPSVLLQWIGEFVLKSGLPAVFLAFGIKYV